MQFNLSRREISNEKSHSIKSREVAQMIMDRYDCNRSGLLEPQELFLMIQHAPMFAGVQRYRERPPSPDEVQGYLELLDLNGDGKVCIEDLEAYISSLFQ